MTTLQCSLTLRPQNSLASWSTDLVEGRRRVRLFIVASAALYGGLNAVAQIVVSSGEATAVATTADLHDRCQRLRTFRIGARTLE